MSAAPQPADTIMVMRGDRRTPALLIVQYGRDWLIRDLWGLRVIPATQILSNLGPAQEP